MRSDTDDYAIMIYLFCFALCSARSSDVDLLILRLSTPQRWHWY